MRRDGSNPELALPRGARGGDGLPARRPAAGPDAARIRRGSEELWRALERLPHALSVGMVALGAGTGGLRERLPTEIACDTLRAHLQAHPASRIARVVFHGFLLSEYVNVLDVVSRAWPEVLEGASAEAQAQVQALRRE